MPRGSARPTERLATGPPGEDPPPSRGGAPRRSKHGTELMITDLPPEAERRLAGGRSTRRRVPTKLNHGVGERAGHGPGDQIAGKYRLERMLGQGGMAEVWLAQNETLGSSVAIKVLRDGLVETNSTERLMREAKVLSRLRHPSIVRVFDLGHTSATNTPFIVMEAVEGRTLAAILDQVGHVPPMSAVVLTAHLAAALGVAHGEGVIHRDVKPENVILEPDETGRLTPKLVDFGIAFVLDGPDRRLTSQGIVVGSPEYQSPEQTKGLEVDPRSDVWALGVMLYELVVGGRPFDGPNALATARNVVGMPAKSFADHEIDEPDLWKIVDKALARKVDDRWPSTSAFRAALFGWALKRELDNGAFERPLEHDWYLHAPRGEPPSPRESSVTVEKPTPSSRQPFAPAKREPVSETPRMPAPKLEAPDVPSKRAPALPTQEMSQPELEEAAARDATVDEELPSRVRPAPEAPGGVPLTAVAGAGFSMAQAFNRALGAPFTAWRAELGAPVGPSTGGGAQALQHISLIGPDGSRLAIGRVDAGKRICTMRSYDMVVALYRERHGADFPPRQGEYTVFLAKLDNLARSFDMRLVTEVVGTRPSISPTRRRQRWWIAGAVGMALVVAVILLVLALR